MRVSTVCHLPFQALQLVSIIDVAMFFTASHPHEDILPPRMG